MMSRIIKTLDIDSTYRNRELWPNPSDFEIPFYYAMGPSSITTSRDPVSIQFPMETNLAFGAYPGVPTTTVTLNSSALPYDDVYNNYLIENDCNTIGGAHGYTRIISYVGATRVATVETAITPTNNYNIRVQQPLFRSTFGAGSTTTQVNLGAAASTVNGFYVNSYVRIFSGGAAFSYAQITAYNGTTRVAIVQPVLPAAPAAGDGYEIDFFSYDNATPLLYNGTAIMNQPVCYEVELLTITLPNVLFENGNRGFMDQYPYFYIKLYSTDSKPGQSSMITNNPNAKEALFRMPMHLYLKDESFFTLDKCKAIQQITMKPDDSLRFTICLPNGEPIILRDADYFSPAPPNPFLQMSATFKLTRMV